MDFKGTSGIQITFDEDGSPRAYQDGGLCITRIRLDPAELAPEGIAEGDVFIREDLRTIIGKFVPPDDDIPDNDFFDDKAVRAGFMLGVFGLYNRLQIQEYRILLWENSQWSRVRARMGQERKRLILAAQRFQDQVLLCFEALLSTLV